MAQTIRTTESRFLFPSLKSDTVVSAFTFLSFLLLVAFSHKQTTTPAVVSAFAAMSELSTRRVMKHIEISAQKPNELGSAEHEVVRNYICEQISAAGLETQ